MNSIITQVCLLLAALISSTGGIYAVVASRKRTDSEAKKFDKESEDIGDKTWIQRLDALSKDFAKLQVLSDERFQRLVEIEMLITEHVSWDFQMVRECRSRGWSVSDPPSLVYVKQKLKEAQERELANGSNSSTPN